MKLLIVDDSMIIRRSIERILTRTRFQEVRVAADGKRAVEEARAFRPDVVTMDITMPQLDGLSAVERIMLDHPETKILVISALGDRHTAVEAVKRGAEGFLLKPFTAEELLTAIEELFESE
ncbi:MAG: response regulator [Verrucomicrobia bacterium]|nr:response regulator [Verrucomicrobiota bacterium]